MAKAPAGEACSAVEAELCFFTAAGECVGYAYVTPAEAQRVLDEHQLGMVDAYSVAGRSEDGRFCRLSVRRADCAAVQVFYGTVH